MDAELAAIVGAEHVVSPVPAAALHDATEAQGHAGSADALVRPADAREVAAVLAWCYEHDVPLTARGGGSGYAGGAAPEGGVVCSLERLTGVRAVDPEGWRMHVEAGLATAHVHRLARESGLWFPPDPGASEQSQIGGNVATNAGGPHAFKYGATGAWVTGLEAVVAPGEVVRLGGPLRKDVAGYDLRGLLVGSEGTLGIVTAVWLRLIPAPEAALPVVGLYDDVESGAAAVVAAMASGAIPAALEFLDAGALAAAPGLPIDGGAGGADFAVIAEADGSPAAARADRELLREALGDGARSVATPKAAELWRWRAGVSHAVLAQRGGKLSEDVGVPVSRLAEAVRGTVEIGERHGLPACSWGHAGDGNLHSTFMLDPADAPSRARAEAAAEELFDLALRLGGTLSGEHGLGRLKAHRLADQLDPGALALQHAVKAALDRKGLLNPGAKLRATTSSSRATPAIVPLSDARHRPAGRRPPSSCRD
jgi:glycolate oxidase subunit GlcD